MAFFKKKKKKQLIQGSRIINLKKTLLNVTSNVAVTKSPIQGPSLAYS